MSFPLERKSTHNHIAIYVVFNIKWHIIRVYTVCKVNNKSSWQKYIIIKKISTCDPLKYKMDKCILIVSIC